MARRTQGTDIWAAVASVTPGEFELLKIECPLNFKPGTDSKDRIETTCLSQEEYKTYLGGGGLKDTGQATFDINADPLKNNACETLQSRKIG